MRLLTAYILREVGVVFFITLSTVTMFFMMVGIAKEAISHGLELRHVIQLLPYLLPNALLYAFPATMLFAVSNVYGRMSASNEIVAVKSLGISPMVLLWPTLICSVALSLATVWVNDIAMSWGYQGIQRVILDAVEDIVYGMLRTQRSYTTRSFSVNVKRVEGRTLVQPIFTFQATEDDTAVTIVAREAELRSKPGSNVLMVIFRDGNIQHDKTSFDFDELPREIPLDEAARKGSGSQSPSHLALRVLPERIYQQRLTIERGEQQLAAQAAYQMMTGDFAGLASARWTVDRRKLAEQFTQLQRLRTEPPRRWANGFSCLCFCLIGAPMAIRLKNAEVLTSFSACFLPILIIYYPLLATGVDRAKAGALPPISVWLANVCLAAWGMWLMRRVVRY